MKIVFAAFLFGIVSLLFTSSLVAAAPVDLEAVSAVTKTEITPSNPIAICPVPITIQDVSLFVHNLGSSADTYTLSIEELPSGWEGTIQKEVTVAGGQNKKVSLFLVNLPDPTTVKPGTYQIKLKAKSNAGNEDTATISVKILNCYSVNLITDEDSVSTCQEKPQSSTFDIEIRNDGKWEEQYTLTSSAQWVTFSQKTVSVDPGKDKKVSVTFNPPASIQGKQDITLTATSTSSYSKDSETVSVTVNDCFNYNVNIQPSEAFTCFSESVDFSLLLSNTGDSDTYTITAPSWVTVSDDEVSIDSGKTKTVTLTAKPQEKGKVDFTVTVTPEEESSNKQQAKASVSSEECRGVAVIMTPENKEVCKDENVEYSVLVKNTGSVEETFVLKASSGDLAKNTISLKPGQSTTVMLTADTSQTGSDVISVTAETDDISDKTAASYTVENCFGASLSLEPESTSACPGSEVSYFVTVENTGKNDDSYTVIYGDTEETLDLKSGEKKEYSFTLPIAMDMKGEYNVVAKLESDNLQKEQTATLMVKEREMCYNVELTDGHEASTRPLKSVALPITVKNTGEATQTYSLSIDGPDWTFLDPTKVTLEKDQEETTYFYVSPPFGTKTGEYSVKIISTSEFNREDLSMMVTVTEDSNGEPHVMVKEDSKENGKDKEKDKEVMEKGETTGNESGLSLEMSSLDELTGEVIRIGGEIAPWKTALVGVLTAIIILILIVRFAVLVRN